MKLVNKIFQIWPKRWVATALIMFAILYLTLVPRPLPDNDIEVPGLDKVVHAVMFGALAFVAVVDLTRRGRGEYAPVSRRSLLCVAAASAATGGLIEELQMAMGAGRSGDWLDFLADAVGAAAGAWLATMALNAWRKQRP